MSRRVRGIILAIVIPILYFTGFGLAGYFVGVKTTDGVIHTGWVGAITSLILAATALIGAAILIGILWFSLNWFDQGKAVFTPIRNFIERKIHGRHRGASEAHRAGAAGSPSDSTGTGGSASGGTGPGVATLPGWYQSPLQQLGQIQMRTANLMASIPLPPPPPSSPGAASDFSGALAVGKVTGARSFAVDNLGRLTGVVLKSVWVPGENEASCLTPGPDFHDETPVPSSRPEGHSMMTCGHGFHAYYEGSNDYHQPRYVSGVIEGYVETIIGTRGFRSMKARIVALHLPADLPTSVRKLVTRNYPDVPVFDTFEGMVAAYPPDDAGQGLNPDSDPDFWTRSAS